jgi:hypothetical protein
MDDSTTRESLIAQITSLSKKAKRSEASREQQLEATRQWRLKHPDYARERRWAIKKEVMAHYGGRCRCCNETELAFLTIDHVGGWGKAHREEVGEVAQLVYADIRRNGFPDGFQVLCHNCHNASNTVEGCPHTRSALLGLDSAL